MAYVGNTPTTQNFISGTDYFNGTGSQTAFTLSRTVASVNDIEAVVNNVVQQPNDAYTISGTTITFTSAPSAGTNNVYVRYLSTTTQAITPSQNTVSWNTLDTNTQQDLGISYKNKIINGNMVIDQRNAGAAVTDANGYIIDRFISNYFGGGTGRWTAQRVTDAPSGFVNSFKVTVTTTDASPSAAYAYRFAGQPVEGFNIADLAWGTASAKTITVSFWVKSSVTGSFPLVINNSAAARGYGALYTISSANTWEYKTVTIPGDTTGTWLTDNSVGLVVAFGAGGSNRTLSANTWTATGGTTPTNVTGAVNLLATNGATWQITGLQLEVGTQATTFTLAGGSYGAELALCERYYEVMQQSSIVGCADGSNVILCPYTYRTIKRASASLSLLTTTITITEPTVAGRTSSGATLGAGTGAGTASCVYQIFGFSGLTNQNFILGSATPNVSVMSISAEL